MKRFLKHGSNTSNSSVSIQQQTSGSSATATATATTSESDSETEKASTPKKAKVYKHKFNEKWLKQFSWLRKTEKNIAFCQCCTTTIKGSLTHITRHDATERHKNNLKKIQSTPKIESFLKNTDDERVLNDNVHASELKLVMFLHEHNLPFLLMDHMQKLLCSVCPDSVLAKNINCGRTKSKALTIECLANESLETTKKQLRESGGVYSLIIDETTDVSLKKSLAVVLRFCYNNKSTDRFIGLIKVESQTAESLFDAVLNLLKNNHISVENMIGLAADNASVMMGQKKGVQARFKELSEDIYVLGCTCHSLHLCSSAACTKLPKSVEEFVRNLYNHFSNSPKRIGEFEEFQKFLEMKPHKMLRASQTRWLSLQAVVNRILLLWDSLKLYFTNLVYEKNEILHTDNVLLENLKNPVYKAYLLFLSYILDIINQMNLQFQSENIQIHMLHTKFSILYKTILKNYIKKTVLDKTDLANISPSNPDIYMKIEDIYMGANVMIYLEETNIENKEVEKFRLNILAFYVELSTQVRKRFKFDDKYLIFLTNFQPKIVISGVVTSIHQASHFFKKIISDVEKLNHEWRLLPEMDHLKNLSDCSFEDFWQEVFKTKNELNDEMFPNVTKLVKAIMCLPHSSAAAERIFSKLNLIKTDLRNRLTVETCNAIMLSNELLGNEKCFTWQPSARLVKMKPKYV